jgi:hypothetical protein
MLAPSHKAAQSLLRLVGRGKKPVYEDCSGFAKADGLPEDSPSFHFAAKLVSAVSTV